MVWLLASRRAMLLVGLAAATVLAAPPALAGAAEDAAGIYSEELEAANSADPVAVAAAMRDAHVGIVRQPFSWARVETAPGQLDYSVYDKAMWAAASTVAAARPTNSIARRDARSHTTFSRPRPRSITRR